MSDAPSLRETLESAMEAQTAEVDAAPAPEAAPESAPVAEATEAPVEAAPSRARDESGRFAKTTKQAATEAKPTAAPPAPAAAKPTGAAPPSAPVASPPSKAPQSWRPALREKWGALDPEVQAEVTRREREAARAIQQHAEAAKSGGVYAEAVRPFEQQIRAMGQEPVAYVGSLLQTASALSRGTPTDKAMIVADLIASFQVPPELLDQALVSRLQGRQMPQPQQQQAPQYRDPRVDQLFSQLEAAKVQRQQAMVTEAQETADTFAESHEFYADVAPTMADILETWGRQGKTQVTEQDLERAYNLACSMDEGISRVLTGRRSADAARAQAPTVQRAKMAASSIKASPGVAVRQQSGPMSLRETIEAAVAGQRT